MKKSLFLIFSIFLMHPIFSQDDSAKDEIFKDWNDINVPGGALSVIQNGQVVYSKGYGSADLEHDIPISSTSVFYIGSVSKQFVTFCILLLEEEGKLNLDDKIQKYLPDFPEYDAPLTIRHFIHHTSGVRDYLTLMALKNRNYLDHTTVDEVYDLIKAQKSLNFTPGERYLYSNSCYFMLAMIVEKASGVPIREYAKVNIFDPLGMKNSLFYDDNTDIIKNRVFSYQKTKGGFNNLINRFDMVGSGGVYSTVDDLYLWDQNFYKNKLGKGGQEIINKMHEEGLLNDGTSTNYGFAIVNGEYKGLKTVYHTGSLAGYRAVQVRFPDQAFTVSILANRSDASPLSKAYKVSEYYLKDQMTGAVAVTKTKSKEIKSVKLKAKQLEPFIGFYWNDAFTFKAEVQVINDTLTYIENGRSSSLIPTSKSTFKIKGEDNDFVNFTTNDASKYRLELVEGKEKLVMEPFSVVDYTKADLQALSGSYYAEELDFTYHLKFENDTLNLYT